MRVFFFSGRQVSGLTWWCVEAVIADSLPVSPCVDGFLSECILYFHLSGLVSESQGKVAKIREAGCESQQKMSNIISSVSPFWIR